MSCQLSADGTDETNKTTFTVGNRALTFHCCCHFSSMRGFFSKVVPSGWSCRGLTVMDSRKSTLWPRPHGIRKVFGRFGLVSTRQLRFWSPKTRLFENGSRMDLKSENGNILKTMTSPHRHQEKQGSMRHSCSRLTGYNAITNYNYNYSQL